MRTGGEIRRNRILELLAAATEPVPGSLLASQLNVSRQVIVTDIALLRTAHPELISTSSGYMLMHASGTRRVYKVKHFDIFFAQNFSEHLKGNAVNKRHLEKFSSVLD